MRKGRTQYKGFTVGKRDMVVWEGQAVVVLSRPTFAAQPEVMKKMTEGLDHAWLFHARAAGRSLPRHSSYSYNSKPTLACVEASVGLGGGVVGSTGVETVDDLFKNDYERCATGHTRNHVLFYEMGRNWWLYEDLLCPPGCDLHNTSINCGFAIFMQFPALLAAGYEPHEWFVHSQSGAALKQSLRSMYERYVANPSATYHNTIFQKKGPCGEPNFGCDMFAAFLVELGELYGGLSEFASRLWKELSKCPSVRTVQDATDNLTLAISHTFGANMQPLLVTQWRWPPLSRAAQLYVQHLPYYAVAPSCPAPSFCRAFPVPSLTTTPTGLSQNITSSQNTTSPEKKHRFWRVRVTESTGAWEWALHGLQLFESTGGNLATPTVSMRAFGGSNRSDCPPHNILDGNDSTFWDTRFAEPNVGKYVEFAFDTPVAVSHARMLQHHHPDNCVDAVAVESSDDCQSWTTEWTTTVKDSCGAWRSYYKPR